MVLSNLWPPSSTTLASISSFMHGLKRPGIDQWLFSLASAVHHVANVKLLHHNIRFVFCKIKKGLSPNFWLNLKIMVVVTELRALLAKFLALAEYVHVFQIIFSFRAKRYRARTDYERCPLVWRWSSMVYFHRSVKFLSSSQCCFSQNRYALWVLHS